MSSGIIWSALLASVGAICIWELDMIFGQSPGAGAAVEQHFAPAENLERIDVALLGEARETLDVAAYVLTDRAVVGALAEAARRGVRVRLYRWRDEREASDETAAALADMAAAGVETRVKERGALMHLKAYCLDAKTLRLGAANFSRSGLRDQDNDLEILRGPGVCAQFEAKFETMWNGKP